MVDVDAAMRLHAFEGTTPAAVFYDFQAAFPSLAHEFKGLTANAADLQAQVKDMGFMLMLMQRLIWMNPLRA